MLFIQHRQGQLRGFTRAVAGCAVVALASCQSTAPGRTRAEFPVSIEETYTVGAPDQLTITVFPQVELNQEVRVRPDGRITMSLIGDVLVEGKTPEEIDTILTRRLEEYLKGAEVTVTVTDFQSKQFYVIGEVAGPGRFPYTGRTSVVDAVLLAGSYSQRADAGRFILIRPSETDPKVLDVDFDEFLRTGDAGLNLYLQPNDILYVPPTGLAKAGYALDNLLFPFQPLIGPAGLALGVYGVVNDN